MVLVLWVLFVGDVFVSFLVDDDEGMGGKSESDRAEGVLCLFWKGLGGGSLTTVLDESES